MMKLWPELLNRIYLNFNFFSVKLNYAAVGVIAHGSFVLKENENRPEITFPCNG